MTPLREIREALTLLEERVIKAEAPVAVTTDEALQEFRASVISIIDTHEKPWKSCDPCNDVQEDPHGRRCAKCHRVYRLDGQPYKCPRCAGPTTRRGGVCTNCRPKHRKKRKK